MKRKIIVIKIGSSVLITKRNKFDEFRLAHIADQIIQLQKEKAVVILVVSGAVARGTLHTNRSYGMQMRENSVLRRAAAGIGQAHLVSTVLKIFEQKKLKVAQILLTRDNFRYDKTRNNLLETLEFYMQNGIIPFFNENDVLDLNSFGGNDFLAGELALFMHASELFILSTPEGSKYGIGGGKTKLEVVSDMAKNNIKTSILNGRIKNIILQTLR